MNESLRDKLVGCGMGLVGVLGLAAYLALSPFPKDEPLKAKVRMNLKPDEKAYYQLTVDYHLKGEENWQLFVPPVQVLIKSDYAFKLDSPKGEFLKERVSVMHDVDIEFYKD